MAKGRAQCIVIRNGKLLVAKHRENDREYYVVPGGGINENESPEDAAIRELLEEACVDGIIISKLAEYADPYSKSNKFYSFLVDIGEQTPSLGYDPEFVDRPVLVGIEWKSLNELCERDRAYFIAAGVLSIPQFVEEINSWCDDISYPSIKR